MSRPYKFITLSDGETVQAVGIVNSEGYLVSSFSSAGVGGGSPVLYSNVFNDFVAETNAAAKTITVSGFATLENRHVQNGLLKVDGVEINLSDATVSGNVITVTSAESNFDGTESVFLFVPYTYRGFDAGLDLYKMSNETSNEKLSTELVINETNVAADTYRKVIPWDGYRNGLIQLACSSSSGTVIMTVFASIDENADDTSDDGWEEIGKAWLQMPSGGLVGNTTAATGLYVIDTDIMPDNLMIKYVTDTAANVIQARIKKYNPF